VVEDPEIHGDRGQEGMKREEKGKKPLQRKEENRQVGRVKHANLRVPGERHPREHVRVPERQPSLIDFPDQETLPWVEVIQEVVTREPLGAEECREVG
jgi:hypothetical protein